MEIVFDRDLYNAAVYGQVFEGDVKDIPDDVAKSLIDRGLAYEWHPKPVKPLGFGGPGTVSCIMPTKNRRQWVPRAIECFLAQTYENRELIIIDNGESIADLIPKTDKIRYMRLNGDQKTGQLRNFCCQISAAEYIANWDDDDWYHPERLAEQIAAIGDLPAVGYDTCYFSGDKGTYLYRYAGGGRFAVGATLLFRRDWWDKHRFPAIQVGEDTEFVARMPEIKVLDGRDRFVASIHDQNTSPRALHGDGYKKAKVSDLPKEYRA